ncbi:MAG TPA: hypothetical protein VFZ61_07495 [Polyangiales bacterium]
MKTARASLWLLGIMLAISLPCSALAEPPAKRGRAEAGKKSRGKARKERKEKKRTPQPDADERRETAAAPKEEGAGSTGVNAAQKAAQDAAQGANAQIVKEGDTSVKVMSFSGLDIEGRLKSPQLLYFVSRVHAEFDRPKLPHRSFMPELKRSGEQEPLR